MFMVMVMVLRGGVPSVSIPPFFRKNRLFDLPLNVVERNFLFILSLLKSFLFAGQALAAVVNLSHWVVGRSIGLFGANLLELEGDFWIPLGERDIF